VSHPDLSTIRANGEKPDTGPYHGDFKPGMEGTIETLAAHLKNDHGYKETDLLRAKAHGDASAWAQLKTLHTTAQMVGARGYLATHGGPA
jgi:hypothetical protein